MSSSILKELPELVSKKIISEEVAQNIKNYYQKNPEENPNKLSLVFGITGCITWWIRNYFDFSAQLGRFFNFN